MMSEPSALAPRRAPSYLFFALVSVVTTALDLGSKAWASRTLSADGPREITRWFNLTLSHNTGGAWGFLHDASPAIRTPFFLVVSTLAIGAIAGLYRKLEPGQRALRWGLPLVLGGAVGNLVDRVRLGSVVDFLQVYATIGGQTHYWPTFNVADIAIVVGVGLMGIDLVQQTRDQMAATRANATKASG
jgi:signal peptidase II